MYSESELIAQLAHYFKECEETMRALAHHRRDEAWIKMAELIHQLREKCAELARRRAA